MSKFLLDSGDPEEYKELSALAKEKGSEVWGSTTNPSLIAKKLAGQKVAPQEAFGLQKDLVMQILEVIPGAVSAEVYADMNTPAENMAEQGREIASWHERVVVKLPTTIEGFKARTLLRKENIAINNTLVFSQEQVFAICLHEQLMNKQYGPQRNNLPAFISPFVGRLDDKGQNGLSFLQNAIHVQKLFEKDLTWMLEASIRHVSHLKAGIDMQCDLLTIPAKVLHEWFTLSSKEQATIDTHAPQGLTDIPVWIPTDSLRDIQTEDNFMNAITSGQLNIHHELTDAGIEKFVADWKNILS